jgi:hypothetical protein
MLNEDKDQSNRQDPRRSRLRWWNKGDTWMKQKEITVSPSS